MSRNLWIEATVNLSGYTFEVLKTGKFIQVLCTSKDENLKVLCVPLDKPQAEELTGRMLECVYNTSIHKIFVEYNRDQNQQQEIADLKSKNKKWGAVITEHKGELRDIKNLCDFSQYPDLDRVDRLSMIQDIINEYTDPDDMLE